MMHRFLLATILILSAVGPSVMADESLFHRHFADGQIAYERGDYEAARDSFLEAAAIGNTSALHHNLGNCYTQLGDNGRAVAHFEKSLALAPRNPDTKANLALTYRRLGRQQPEPTTLTTIAQTLTINTWSWLTAASFWLTVFFIAFPKFLDWRPLASWSARIAAVGAFAVCICALLGYHSLAALAIVTDGDTPLHPSPSRHSQPVAYLQPGEVLSVADRHGDFSRVTLQSGRSGWILSSDIIPVWDNQ